MDGTYDRSSPPPSATCTPPKEHHHQPPTDQTNHHSPPTNHHSPPTNHHSQPTNAGTAPSNGWETPSSDQGEETTSLDHPPQQISPSVVKATPPSNTSQMMSPTVVTTPPPSTQTSQMMSPTVVTATPPSTHTSYPPSSSSHEPLSSASPPTLTVSSSPPAQGEPTPSSLNPTLRDPEAPSVPPLPSHQEAEVGGDSQTTATPPLPSRAPEAGFQQSVSYTFGVENEEEEREPPVQHADVGILDKEPLLPGHNQKSQGGRVHRFPVNLSLGPDSRTELEKRCLAILKAIFTILATIVLYGVPTAMIVIGKLYFYSCASREYLTLSTVILGAMFAAAAPYLFIILMYTVWNVVACVCCWHLYAAPEAVAVAKVVARFKKAHWRRERGLSLSAKDSDLEPKVIEEDLRLRRRVTAKRQAATAQGSREAGSVERERDEPQGDAEGGGGYDEVDREERKPDPDLAGGELLAEKSRAETEAPGWTRVFRKRGPKASRETQAEASRAEAGSEERKPEPDLAGGELQAEKSRAETGAPEWKRFFRKRGPKESRETQAVTSRAEAGSAGDSGLQAESNWKRAGSPREAEEGNVLDEETVAREDESRGGGGGGDSAGVGAELGRKRSGSLREAEEGRVADEEPDEREQNRGRGGGVVVEKVGFEGEGLERVERRVEDQGVVLAEAAPIEGNLDQEGVVEDDGWPENEGEDDRMVASFMRVYKGCVTLLDRKLRVFRRVRMCLTCLLVFLHVAYIAVLAAGFVFIYKNPRQDEVGTCHFMVEHVAFGGSVVLSIILCISVLVHIWLAMSRYAGKESPWRLQVERMLKYKRPFEYKAGLEWFFREFLRQELGCYLVEVLDRRRSREALARRGEEQREKAERREQERRITLRLEAERQREKHQQAELERQRLEAECPQGSKELDLTNPAGASFVHPMCAARNPTYRPPPIGPAPRPQERFCCVV